MPSTYSSSLRLEEPAVGEQVNTWGTTANTDYDLIDSAIAGVAAVNFSSDANVTLTSFDGAADQARNMVLNCTSSGSLTATRDVIAPAVSKLYVIKNGTSGSQSIRLKTSGGSGFTVPNGNTAIVWCDGTDMHAALDYFNGTFVGNVTGNLTGNVTGNVTGNLTGGVTSSAVTITGGTVNGTSIGNSTPASGAFTTVTGTVIDGVTVKQNGTALTGIFFPLAGGTVTGATTISNALVVDGTTFVVDNTNDRVGIGTTSPSKQLHITKSAVADIQTVAYAATVNLDFNAGQNFKTTVTGAMVIGTPSNITPGMEGHYVITMDSTGGWAVTFSSEWKFKNSTPSAITTTANAVSRVDFFVVDSTHIQAAVTSPIG